MKMKFILLAAAVAMMGFSGSAQVFTKLVEPTEDLTKLLTPSNATRVSDKNTAAGKLPGIQVTGSVDGKNVLVVDDVFKNQTWGVLGPDGETIGVTYNDKNEDGTMKLDYIRFRYNTGNKGRGGESRQLNAVRKEKPNDYSTAYIKLVVGPKPAEATSDVLTPTIELISVKDANNGDATYKMTFAFPEITLTDETQEVELDMTGVSGSYFDEEGAVKQLNINYVDAYIRGLSEGQFVALTGFGFANFYTPKVGFDTESTKKYAFNYFPEVPVGTIYIQAEDFDGNKDGEPAFSPICASIDTDWRDGYGYPQAPSATSHWTKGDLSNVRINKAEGMNGGFGTYNQRTGENSSTNGGFAMIGMAKCDGEWGTNYGGEYLDETSNKISLEQAMDGFGSWFEYTFEMEQDGYVDISICAGTHAGTAFNNVIAGGTTANQNAYYTKYQKPREEGGYEVEGLDDDFLKLYGFCYVLSFDGVDQPTNWDRRPMGNKRTGAISAAVWSNPELWTDTREDAGDGTMVNSKFLFITPSFGEVIPGGNDGMLWFPYYIGDKVDRWYGEQVTDPDNAEAKIDSPFKKACDAIAPDYYELTYKNRPDYKDIECKAGKHTIRVKSMGGSTIFDEIKITAHKEKSSSGIENIATNRVAEEFSGDVEYFDLQGRKVAAPSKGIFIVKRGSVVTKEVIR